jgi:hypothetical protein
MLSYLIGAVGVAALCAGWVLVQRWVATRDPEIRGPESGCHGCGGCGSCDRRTGDPVSETGTERREPAQERS